MILDTEFSLSVKITDMYISDNLSEEEKKDLLIKEGEKRLRYYLSGYLLDPENKVINKNIIIHNQKQ